VRLGLVAVGAVFALVGGAVIVGAIMPVTSPTYLREGSSSVENLQADDSRTFTMNTTVANSASLAVSWSSSSAVSVSWYATRSCASPPYWCAVTPAIVSWAGKLAGHWSGSGDVGDRYLLYVETDAAANGSTDVFANFTGTYTEHYHTLTHAALAYPFLLTMTSGSLLAGTGAVALYLGLFLPSGTYAPPDDEEGEPDPQGSGGGPT